VGTSRKTWSTRSLMAAVQPGALASGPDVTNKKKRVNKIEDKKELMLEY
jgi:hypothetical protein